MSYTVIEDPDHRIVDDVFFCLDDETVVREEKNNN